MEDLTKLREAIKNHKEDDVWQSILNVGYHEWQSDNVTSYTEMIEWMRKNYGDFAVMAILLGKYNQQVCNGGHMQYYDNGYASRDDDGTSYSGFGHDHGEQIALHEEIIKLMEKYGLDKESDLSKKLYALLKEFKVDIDDELYIEESCYECDGSGCVYEYDEDENENVVECSICGGSGYDEVDNENYGYPTNQWEWSNLDDRYYEFSDEWVDWFGNYVSKKLS